MTERTTDLDERIVTVLDGRRTDIAIRSHRRWRRGQSHEQSELDHVGARIIRGSTFERVVVGMTQPGAARLRFAGIREQLVADSLLASIALTSTHRPTF